MPPRPRILVTTSSKRSTTGLDRYDVLGGLNYAEALRRAGALPLFLPNLDPERTPELVSGWLDVADGVLLSGGGDIDPYLFGQEPHPRLGYVDPTRDALEIALYRGARERGMPLLGICRGIQIVNVAEGGDLHQHLPDAYPETQHEQRDTSGAPLKRVRLEPDSVIARAHGATEIAINSFHHQAIDRLGDNLRVTARSADGLIEAVESTNGSFVLAVQWHPEMSFERFPEHLASFEAFVAAVLERTAVAGD